MSRPNLCAAICCSIAGSIATTLTTYTILYNKHMNDYHTVRYYDHYPPPQPPDDESYITNWTLGVGGVTFGLPLLRYGLIMLTREETWDGISNCCRFLAGTVAYAWDKTTNCLSRENTTEDQTPEITVKIEAQETDPLLNINPQANASSSRCSFSKTWSALFSKCFRQSTEPEAQIQSEHRYH